jgi:hypothetical protein
MKKLDRRGVAALEFCLVIVPLFTLMFAIVDLGRYAITVHNLRMLASAEAREMMIQCYTSAVISSQLPTNCTADYVSDSDKQTYFPFLYAGGLSPHVTVAVALAPNIPPPPAKGALTVTTYIPNFTMIWPIWPAAFNATVSCSTPNTYPCVSTSIPF